MPKTTFFNLPDEKRQRIIDVALEEFGSYDYNTASLSRIVEEAGIAKGSMYQYFENKKDLYMYLLKLSGDVKLDYITRHLNPSEKDFFKLYKDMLLASAKFDLNYPHYSRIMYNASKETNNKELGNVASQLLQMSDAYIEKLIAKAQNGCQVRKDIPKDLIAFLITRISVYLTEYIDLKFGFLYGDIVKNRVGKLPISDEELGKVLDDVVKFLKSGLKF